MAVGFGLTTGEIEAVKATEYRSLRIIPST
jgi:hypothetical protein